MSSANYDPRGNANVADVVGLEYGANQEQLLEKFMEFIRWLGDREPVAPGDPFIKFATRGYLVSKGLLTENDVLGNDDDQDPEIEVEPEMVVVYAREMFSSTTLGADPIAVVEVSADKPNLQTVDFPKLNQTSAEFQLVMPPHWVGGSFQFRVYWSHTSGGTGFGTAWELQAHSATDSESLVPDWVNGTIVTDTGGSTDTLYISPESEAVPISGSTAKAGDLVLFRISRVITDAGDTLSIPCRLHAIRFNTGETPVEFPPIETDSTWDTSNTTGGTWVFSNGDKTAQYTTPASGLAIQSVAGTVARSAGKRYFEIELTQTLVSFGTSVRHDLGVTYSSIPISSGDSGQGVGIGYRRGGAIYTHGTSVGTVTALTSGDVVGVAIDIDTGKVWLSLNGTYTQGDPAADTSPEATLTASIDYRPFFSAESLAYSTATIRTTLAEFTTAPPSGYISWASA